MQNKEEVNRLGGLGVRKRKRDEEGNTVLAEEIEGEYAVNYILQLVKCGKAAYDKCRKCREEGGHGPYLYKVYRQREDQSAISKSKPKKEYIGTLEKAKQLQQEGFLTKELDLEEKK